MPRLVCGDALHHRTEAPIAGALGLDSRDGCAVSLADATFDSILYGQVLERTPPPPLDSHPPNARASALSELSHHGGVTDLVTGRAP